MPLVRKKLLNSKFHKTMKSNLLKAAIVALLVVISMPIHAQTENICVYRNGSVIFTQAVSQIDSITFRTSETDNNVEALNRFLKDNNYFSEIGLNFNTDERGDDLIFSFRNNSRLRGFGIIQNGTVYTSSFLLEYDISARIENITPTVAWNGDYIVYAINGGVSEIGGLIGYTMQGRDFSTVKKTWENRSALLRYAWIELLSEVIDNTYYLAVTRSHIYWSTARVNMETGDIVFSDSELEAKKLVEAIKVNDLYYGIMIKHGYSTRLLVSVPQYYNIFDNYTIIRSDSNDAFTHCRFSYTKRRAALIDFFGNIVRPIYLNGEIDMEVPPATLTIIPDFEYKGKYYARNDNENDTQFTEIEVPYDLFDDKYIEVE
jgi:hypothetical protein